METTGRKPAADLVFCGASIWWPNDARSLVGNRRIFFFTEELEKSRRYQQDMLQQTLQGNQVQQANQGQQHMNQDVDASLPASGSSDLRGLNSSVLSTGSAGCTLNGACRTCTTNTIGKVGSRRGSGAGAKCAERRRRRGRRGGREGSTSHQSHELTKQQRAARRLRLRVDQKVSGEARHGLGVRVRKHKQEAKNQVGYPKG